MANPTISQIKVGDITYDVCDATSRDTLFNQGNPAFHQIKIVSPEIDTVNFPASNINNSSGTINFTDNNGVPVGAIRIQEYTSGTAGLRLVWRSNNNNWANMNLLMGAGESPVPLINFGQYPGSPKTTKKAFREALDIDKIGTIGIKETTTSTALANKSWKNIDSITIPGNSVYLISIAAAFEGNTTGSRIIHLGSSSTAHQWVTGGNSSALRKNAVSTAGTSQATILRSTFIGDYSTTSNDSARYLWAYQDSGSSLNVLWTMIRYIRINVN